MIELLKTKKAIFFDVGYTLEYPISGDWMYTNKFKEIAGENLNKFTKSELEKAKDKGFESMENHPHIETTEEELDLFLGFYHVVSDELKLNLTDQQVYEIAYDRTFNMENYALYPGTVETLNELSKTHMLGVISDTWPSIELQLQTLGVRNYFKTTTYSCALGTSKPDRRMYQDALDKMNVSAEDAVFVDDLPKNLNGAKQLGITPILIAANQESDVTIPFLKIHALKELLETQRN